VFALVMVGAGRWQDKVGPRAPALVGAALLTIGSLLASTVRSPQQLGTWVLAYGVIYGAGIGMAYVCPIAALSKWFPDIKGLITGVAVAGFGGGAAFFVPNVKTYLTHHAVADYMQIHAVICLVVVAIGASLLRNPPAGWVAPVKAAPAEGAAPRPKVESLDLEPRPMIATPRFWLLWAMFMGAAVAGLMTISFAAALAGAGAASVLAVFNACGRIGWGGVSDRIGRERAMLAMFGFQALVMVVLCFVNTTLKPDTALAIVLMGLVGLNFGGCFAVFPSATADAFGTRNLGINYGLVFTAYGVAGVVGPLVGAYFKDTVKSYTPAFGVAAVLVLLAAAGAVLAGAMKAKTPAAA